jgi:hypothetical protein
LEIPPEEKLLGELIVPGSRTFLVGSTGLGKTLFGYELVGGMISGKGFLARLSQLTRNFGNFAVRRRR